MVAQIGMLLCVVLGCFCPALRASGAAPDPDLLGATLKSQDPVRHRLALRRLVTEMWAGPQPAMLPDVLRGLPAADDACAAVNDLRAGKYNEGLRALDFLADLGAADVLSAQVANPNLSVAAQAARILRERNLRESLPVVRQTLVRMRIPDRAIGAGIEYQEMYREYLRELWRSHLSLSGDLDGDWNAVPSREDLQRLFAEEPAGVRALPPLPAVPPSTPPVVVPTPRWPFAPGALASGLGGLAAGVLLGLGAAALLFRQRRRTP